MAPLSLEIYNPKTGGWKEVGRLGPGKRPGSISDNRPDGRRDVYVFSCAEDNSHSAIQRSAAGIDGATEQLRAISTVGAEIVKVLHAGETYEMNVKTDVGKQTLRIRFRHF